MGMTRRVSLVAVLLVALLAVPAMAKTVRYKRFVSPSGMIRCIAVKYGGKGVECGAPYIREIGELDTYYGLEPHGKAFIGERGDFPGYPNSKERTLQYGDTYSRKGVRCTMREDGMTCRNKDGHGFHMAKGDTHRF
jgi:hypothetical protein